MRLCTEIFDRELIGIRLVTTVLTFAVSCTLLKNMIFYNKIHRNEWLQIQDNNYTRVLVLLLPSQLIG